MRVFRAHSRLLGLVTRQPLGHGLVQFNSCAAAPMSSALARQDHKLNPASQHAVHFVTKMSETSEVVDISSDESSTFQPSTAEDVNLLTVLLKEIIELKNIGGRSGLGDEKIKTLCKMYKFLTKSHKEDFILTLATEYAVDHERISTSAQNITEATECRSAIKLAKSEDALRNALTPQYSWFFKRIGRLEHGVKFLVDLRTDILNCLVSSEPDSGDAVALQQLNATLRELLAMWFSIGFLRLERVTWRSPCEMLQKISEYEAVHPVRSWTDIKRRVGPYRRCFVFTHSSMEGEPLVVLHTALCDEIPGSLAGIVSSRTRMSADMGSSAALSDSLAEDTVRIQAGIFYSITSTQRGLQGIDLGNYLIKRVVRELQAEFPRMSQFSTLSPIPAFRPWLLDRIKAAERGRTEVLTSEELDSLKKCIEGDFWPELRRVLKNNSWVDSLHLSAALQAPLLRLCARYLYLEKRRGFALCSVGNFHLSNGAVLWRINWRADLSIRGLSNSCGIMVNYRYFLEDTERNSEQYLGQQVVSASDQVASLAAAADAVAVMSKM